MKKIICGLAISFVFLVNFSMCQASKVPIYNNGAEDMLDEVKYIAKNELSADSFPYVMRNFRFVGNLDEQMKQTFNLPNKNFKVYTCNLHYINSKSSDGIMAFIVDDRDTVFSVILTALVDKNASKKQQEKSMEMLLLTSAVVFYSFMDESDLGALVKDMTENTAKGQWGVWSGEKFVNCQIGKADDGFILMIDATDGKN